MVGLAGWFGLIGSVVGLIGLDGLVGLIGWFGSFVAMSFIKDSNCQTLKTHFWMPPTRLHRKTKYVQMLAAICWAGWFVWLVGWVGLVCWFGRLAGWFGLVGFFVAMHFIKDSS